MSATSGGLGSDGPVVHVRGESSTPLVVPLAVSRLQAWNRRIEKLIDSPLEPVSRNIKVRTEFSGACTAEEAMLGAAVLFNSRLIANRWVTGPLQQEKLGR